MRPIDDVVPWRCLAHHSTLFLGRALRQDRKRELECAASCVGAMRKILMVSSTDRKDAQPVEHRAYIQTDRQVIPVQRAAMHAKCTSTGRRMHNIRMLTVDCFLHSRRSDAFSPRTFLHHDTGCCELGRDAHASSSASLSEPVLGVSLPFVGFITCAVIL